MQAWLADQGRGFAIRTARVPIVPAAILFDLLNGGDKNWGRYPPYRELGYAAAARPSLSSWAARGGARRNHRHSQGRPRLRLGVAPAGFIVGALAAVNAAGSVVVGEGPWFWAAPYEREDEFGERGFPPRCRPRRSRFRTKSAPGESTTLAVVATDARLTKVQAKRLAIMAQDGLARAIRPVHTPLDGDVVFAAAIGRHPLADRSATGGNRRRRRRCAGGRWRAGLRGDRAPITRVPRLGATAPNNWITRILKGLAALTLPSIDRYYRVAGHVYMRR